MTPTATVPPEPRQLTDPTGAMVANPPPHDPLFGFAARMTSAPAPKPPSRALDLGKSVLPSALCGLAGILMADHHAVVWVKAHAAEFMAALTAAWGFIERIQAAAPKVLAEGQQVATALAPVSPQASAELSDGVKRLQTVIEALQGQIVTLHKKVDAVSATSALPPNPLPPPPAAFEPKPTAPATPPATT